MVILLAIVAMHLATPSGATSVMGKEEEAVLSLTTDTFHKAIKTQGPMLVEFYAPWCHHCKELAPEFEKAAQNLLKEGIRFAKVDATQETELAKEYGISGYPVIKWIDDTKVQDYDGQRTAASLELWVEKRTGREIKELSVLGLPGFLSSDSVAVIGVFDNPLSEEYKEFAKIARETADVGFGAVSSEIAAQGSIPGYDGSEKEAVIVVHAGGVGEVFDGNTDLSTWLRTHTTPLVIPFSAQTARTIFNSGVDTHVLLFTNEDDDEHIDTLRTIAMEHRDSIVAVTVGEKEKQVLRFFDLTPASFPALQIASQDRASGAMRRYEYDGELSVPHIRSFLFQYFDGDVQPVRRSEPVQDTDKDGDVVIVRGKSFQDIVMDASKDVLVQVYSPTCPHCISLAPTYESLAKQVSTKHKPNLVIAKLDGKSNEIDVPGLPIRGFPTIFLSRKGDNEIIPFQGSRTVESLLAFLEKNTDSLSSFAEDL